MGMNNDDIEKMIASVENGETDLDTIEEMDTHPENNAVETPATTHNPVDSPGFTVGISQDEMDSLLSTFVADDDDEHESLIEEIHSAILDSAKLTLMQWVNLRKKLREIEELIPHIDLLIRLKSKKEKEKPELFG